jgi:hypothetical protein
LGKRKRSAWETVASELDALIYAYWSHLFLPFFFFSFFCVYYLLSLTRSFAAHLERRKTRGSGAFVRTVSGFIKDRGADFCLFVLFFVFSFLPSFLLQVP